MTFEKDYNELLFFAKNSIIKENTWCLEANDAVNDAYIYLVEKGIPYSLNEAKKKIYNLVKTQSQIQKPIGLTDVSKPTFSRPDEMQDCYCKKCKQVKPEGAFYSYFDSRIKKIRRRHCCIDCANKYGKLYRSKQPKKISKKVPLVFCLPYPYKVNRFINSRPKKQTLDCTFYKNQNQ